MLKRSILAVLLLLAVPLGSRAEVPRTWHVFLIAADRAEPVFDNAVERLAALFKARYGVAAEAFTARVPAAAGKREATWQEIGRTVSARRMAPGDACFFYFTTHGDVGGIFMARHDALLPPSYMAELLDRTCGRRPTIVVISACHSGTFLRARLMTENRVILTAARRDRSSFGCSFTETLTVYDRCFLDNWDKAANWLGMHAALTACVRATERARRFSPPSEPQAHVGRLMRAFPLRPEARGL